MGLTRLIGVVLGGAVLGVAGGCGLTGDDPDLVAGKQQFVERCGSCHVLNRADTAGTQGPNLDEAFQQALRDGMKRSGIAGVVEAQIDTPARLSERDPVSMPADLVTGDDARNVAAYVAEVAARPGEDQGRLATDIKRAGGGKPVAAEGGKLEIPATAQLAYEANAATADPGRLEIDSPNPSGTPHNIALEGGGVDEAGEVVQNGGVSKIFVDVKPGKYTFYCTVPGHRAAGMEGTLTVK